MSIVLVGSTSGSITLQEPAVAGTTVLDLPAVSGTLVTTNSPALGNVIQVVNATYGTLIETTSSSYVTSNLTASITPKFSTSKILAIVNFPASIKASTRQVTYTLYRNSTNLAPNNLGQLGYGQIYSDSGNLQAMCCMNVYDSPATTSATTYTMYFASTNGGQVQIFNNYLTGNITLLEIAA